jgi:hypothetical protein
VAPVVLIKFMGDKLAYNFLAFAMGNITVINISFSKKIENTLFNKRVPRGRNIRC